MLNVIYQVLFCFGLFTSSLTNDCWVALSSCVVWPGASVWGVSLGLQVPPLLLYRAHTGMCSGGVGASSVESIFKLVPPGLMISLGSLSEGFGAWAAALLTVLLWQNVRQKEVCVSQCLQCWALPSSSLRHPDCVGWDSFLTHGSLQVTRILPWIFHNVIKNWLSVSAQGSTLEKAINHGDGRWLLSAHLQGHSLGKEHLSNLQGSDRTPLSFSHYITAGASTKAIWVAQGSVLWKTIPLWWLIQEFI